MRNRFKFLIMITCPVNHGGNFVKYDKYVYGYLDCAVNGYTEVLLKFVR